MARNVKDRKAAAISFERVYQYSDGVYLPDSSQPNPAEDYEITASEYTPHKSTRYINVFVSTDSSNDFSASDKMLPELYSDRENCCGCSACFAICPAQAVIMRPDEEGFLYPVVDAEKCLRCYQCMSVCAFKDRQKEKGYLA